VKLPVLVEKPSFSDFWNLLTFLFSTGGAYKTEDEVRKENFTANTLSELVTL
jgi:hypothetical protein